MRKQGLKYFTPQALGALDSKDSRKRQNMSNKQIATGGEYEPNCRQTTGNKTLRTTVLNRMKHLNHTPNDPIFVRLETLLHQLNIVKMMQDMIYVN